MAFINSRSMVLPGVRVRDEQGAYTVLDLINLNEVLVRSEDGEKSVKKIDEVSLDISEPDVDQIDITTIDRDLWDEACEVALALGPLVDAGKYRRKKEDVIAVAEKLHVHPSSVYRWLDIYERTGQVSSLLRKKRSDRGIARLPEKIEKIVQSNITKHYLNDQRKTIKKVHQEISSECRKLGLTAPDLNTLRSRILQIPEEQRVSAREGEKAAEEQFGELKGSFPGADYPLSVVQIDHTPMDVIVVDDMYRLPIGRPHLTLAIDIYSKMVVGFYISLDPPGALSTGICLSNAILGKEKYLHDLGIDIEWPCWGVMRTIHSDNAAEFKGTMLGRAAKQYQINPERRPKGKPRYGGHIERAFRTYMGEVHDDLPGTTFSNVVKKREYDSEGKAVMTMGALEAWFTYFIVGVYHQRSHSGNNGISPIVQWMRGILGDGDSNARGIPVRYKDEEKLRLDFLPFQERTVQEYGLQLEKIYYWSDALRKFIHAKEPGSFRKKRLFICRFDPRNLSKLWLLDPDSKEYIQVPYRDLSRPPISIWELKAVKKALRAESRSSVNEEVIFQTLEKMRKIVETETHKTKSARKLQQRKKNWESKTEKPIAPAPNLLRKPLDDDPFDDFEIKPFSGIRES